MRSGTGGACALLAALAPLVAIAAPSFAVLHNFAGGKDGATPSPGSGGYLTLDSMGVIYGATGGGDVPSDFGTIYTLSPPQEGNTAWTENVLYRLKGGKAGVSPGTVLLSTSNVSYGAAFEGGGTSCMLYGTVVGCGLIYQLTPPSGGKKVYTLTTLHKFLGGNDGGGPEANLVADGSGNLYGMTYIGGTGSCASNEASAGCGTVFELSPPSPGKKAWVEKILYSFQGGTDGSYPEAGLAIDVNGTLYGMTPFGGPANAGTVFSLTPPSQGQKKWTEAILYSFKGGNDGLYPGVPPAFDDKGALLGTTSNGGSSRLGTIFRLVPPSHGQGAWAKTTLHAFMGGIDGAYPNTGLTAISNGAFVTTTIQGGTGTCTVSGTVGCGTIVEIVPPSKGQRVWAESVLYSLNGAVDGAAPYGGLTVGGQGVIYGTSTAGGSGPCPNSYPIAGCGTVFSYTP